MEKLDLSQYSIFYPDSKNSIVKDYPELKNYESFRNISNNDALFVWYYACEASPLHKITSNKERASQAINKAYVKKGGPAINKDKRNKLLTGDFPDKMRQAIEDMSRFKLGPRLLIQQTIEKALHNTAAIINIELDDELFKGKDGDGKDMTAYKEYMQMISTAESVMPSLLSRLEGNFGVSKKKGSKPETEESFDEENFADNYHQESEN